MTLFPDWFLAALVFAGIAIAAVAVLVLLALLVRDYRRKLLW